MIESTALVAEPVTSENAETRRQRRACVFSLAGSLFAVDVRSAREVAAFDTLTIVPRAPACLLGVANHRGIVVPVADIRPLLGLPALRQRIGLKALVVEDAPAKAAVAIDAALGLEWFDEAGMPDDGHGIILGRRHRGDDRVTLLDVGELLAALKVEMRRIR